MVPLPLGPEMGMVMSALPELPATLIEPEAKKPGSIGVPSRSVTRASLCAFPRASLYASELFIALAANRTMHPMNAAKSAMIVRQPTGANHFQLRDHQPRCGGGSSGGAGGRTVGGLPDGVP